MPIPPRKKITTDGTDRKPRKEQKYAVMCLNMKPNGNKVIIGPTGVGKSWIARAVQRATGGHIIVPSNILMNETYLKVYPEVNFLKGKSHYMCCTEKGLTCEMSSQLNDRHCNTCPYKEAKDKAVTEPTIFNPMSYFYWLLSKPLINYDTLIIDEAHLLRDMLLMISGKSFKHSRYNFPDNATEPLVLIPWLELTMDRLKRSIKNGDLDKSEKKKNEDDLLNIYTLYEGIKENCENYSLEIDTNNNDRFLHVKPIKVPKYLLKKFFNVPNVILLGATIMDTDITDLLGNQKYDKIELNTPIPPENRKIHYKPTGFKMNYKSDPQDVAEAIEKIIVDEGTPNTIVHVSYAWQQKLLPHFTIPILHNSKENKNDVVNKFISDGGVFLAAGCSEGLDLHDNICRLNIIPMIIMANITVDIIKKRMALPDGKLWYDLEAIKQIIQQAGRSTRHDKDKSKVVIMDNKFPSLISKRHKYLPLSFLEAIK